MALPAGSQRRGRPVAACSATVDAMTDLASSSPARVNACAGVVAREYVLDIVIPVYNEERDLPGSVRRLHEFLAAEVPYPARITVADNASTDGTLEVARRLADELPDVDVIHLENKGRGGALRAAWTTSPADVVAYMDVDLSTDLTALMPLVAPPTS